MLNFIKTHKKTSALILLIIAGASYYAYTKFNVTTVPARYVLEAVKKETLVTSVSGSGQVALLEQLDITPKISGDLASLKVKAGQEVAAGDVISQINCSDLNKQLRDARISLASAQVSMTKLKRGATADEIKTANDKVVSAQRTISNTESDLLDARTKAVNDLTNTYEDAVTTLNDTYSKANDVVTRQINSLYNNPQNDTAEINFITSDSQLSGTASWKRSAAINASADFKNAISTLNTDQSAIDSSLVKADTYLTTVTDFLNDLSKAVEDGVATLDVSQSTLNSYAATVNSAKSSITALSNDIKTQKRAISNQITTNKNNITAAEKKVADAKESLVTASDNLASLKSGPDSLDVQTQNIALQQKQNSVTDILENFKDCSITAPFAGVISDINSKIGDTLSTATNLATLITKQKVAEVSLNEVDVAKVKIGQKATLTFDAIENLELSGQVVSIDTLGTTNQGVVSYGVKISFDTQDDRIKPGMTVSSSIITEVRADVLTVSSGAIKQNNNGDSYVEIIDNPIAAASGVQGVTSATDPRQQIVTTGISNDISTEIISGLNEGDKVVTKTISASTASAAKTSKTSGSSAAGLLGGFSGGGPRN